MNSLDFGGLGQLRADAAATKDAKNNPALRKAAEQFEALFLQTMLKTMREATEATGEDLFGNNASKTYQDLFDKEVAQQMAKRGGLGLADMMIKSFNHNQGTSSGVPSAAQALAARQKGLPIAPEQQALPVRQESAAGFALTKDKVKTEINRDRLVVRSTADRQLQPDVKTSGDTP